MHTARSHGQLLPDPPALPAVRPVSHSVALGVQRLSPGSPNSGRHQLQRAARRAAEQVTAVAAGGEEKTIQRGQPAHKTGQALGGGKRVQVH